jgi:hypothetical protein
MTKLYRESGAVNRTSFIKWLNTNKKNGESVNVNSAYNNYLKRKVPAAGEEVKP